MDYRVESKRLGGKHVIYNCPHCDLELESKLSTAGTFENCPGCSKSIVVPGRQDLEAETRGKQTQRQEKQKEFEAQQKAKKAAKKKEIELKAERQLRVNTHHQETDSHARAKRSDAVSGLAFDDRILGFCLGTARWFTGVLVLLVIITLFTGGIGAIIAAVTYKDSVVVYPFLLLAGISVSLLIILFPYAALIQIERHLRAIRYHEEAMLAK